MTFQEWWNDFKEIERGRTFYDMDETEIAKAAWDARDEEIAELQRLNRVMAERIAGLVEIVAKRAEK